MPMSTASVARHTCGALGRLLWCSLALVGLRGASPDQWFPARWDGGPLEVSRRAKDKALADPALRDAIARWYEPATLGLLDGTPVNCLLLTLSGGTDRELEQRQQQLVKAYARKARERGFAVLGLVYPRADPLAAASAAADARLDGVVLEGEFPAGFIERIQKMLRSTESAAVVIPAASSSAPIRTAAWPVLAIEGNSPGVRKIADGAVASATAGLWVDSNMWLVRSLRLHPDSRPVWLTHRPGAGLPGDYRKSIADAAAAGGRWIIALHDDLRVPLLRQDAKALGIWRSIGNFAAFFAERADWRSFVPFGAVGIILDTAGANLANSEEFLNLVARRQIPYRVIERARLEPPLLADLRAVLAFDLAPPSDAERRILRDFAAHGGLVLGGPAWGSPPKEQSYSVVAVGQGEVAVYREESPDPQSVAFDLNDLLTTPDFGVSLFHAPSVLPYVTASGAGERMLIHLVNYSDAPTASLTIWVNRRYRAARLYTPESPPADLPLKRSGSRTEIGIPPLAVYGALLLE